MKNESTLSGLTVANFSKQIDGKETMLCILTNNKGAELTITNYGAKIVSLMVPDRSGKLTDVVTGHNSIDEYLVSEEPYFGAICGRYGNRIAGGKFTLDGIVYEQPAWWFERLQFRSLGPKQDRRPDGGIEIHVCRR